MRYFKEIVKAILKGKGLPGLGKLIGEYESWTRFKNNRDVFKNALPWIAFWAIDFLDREVTKEHKVLEYGGGGSTLFFSSRVGELVTVEHNREWFTALQKEMNEKSTVKWTGIFVEPEDAGSVEGLDKGNPDHYYSGDEGFKNKVFKKYASTIDAYPDEFFDVVLVDGRARPSCLLHSLKKVKMNGLLVLDNADRTYYREQVGASLGDYTLLADKIGPTPYVEQFTQAAIWRRTQ